MRAQGRRDGPSRSHVPGGYVIAARGLFGAFPVQLVVRLATRHTGRNRRYLRPPDATLAGMVIKLSELGHGERFEARDPMGTLQYAGYRGHEEYDDSYVTITRRAGVADSAVHRLEEIQQDCDQWGFVTTRV
jgi:hypothetical protein